MAAKSATCEFEPTQISQLRRIAAKRAATAAFVNNVESPVWAVLEEMSWVSEPDAAVDPMAAVSPF